MCPFAADAIIISCSISLLVIPFLSKHYLPACLLSMSTVFFSGHGNSEDWLSCTSRKCCEDNRMCPGSAVEGRRIQGSYCTLWNGLRNARCLPFFFSLGLCRITLEATGFEDNVTPPPLPHRLIHMWHCAGKRMFVVTHLHILLWQLWRLRWRNKTSLSCYSGRGHRRSWHGHGHNSVVDGKPATWKYTRPTWTLRRLWEVISKNRDKFSKPSKSDVCKAPDRRKSRCKTGILSSRPPNVPLNVSLSFNTFQTARHWSMHVLKLNLQTTKQESLEQHNKQTDHLMNLEWPYCKFKLNKMLHPWRPSLPQPAQAAKQTQASTSDSRLWAARCLRLRLLNEFFTAHFKWLLFLLLNY